ncbi:hypothetical protein B0F90DRAFT_1341343 [Multifurca ochricompacta]|uniref:DUF6535 domain-containing protein n=1 Tax=Multifurca ochricompacta TaxID=376703 RepID=A0AAD4QKG2_9AGAM|nr:hypothetical protein B0F90DRAFT_1341343 [Multifurca ochricompacta]
MSQAIDIEAQGIPHDDDLSVPMEATHSPVSLGIDIMVEPPSRVMSISFQDLARSLDLSYNVEAAPRKDDVLTQPTRARNTSTQAEASFPDVSDPFFSMYNEAAKMHDQKMAKRWKDGADSAIIVTGLFSIMVATLLGRSYQALNLNSQDISAFYLSQIYQLSAPQQNGSSIPLPIRIPDPSTFSPATSAVWVSALWSLSLVISLYCTLVATLLQQWERQYLHTTQDPRGPRMRARIRELMAQGVERMQLQQMVSLMPALFHLAIFSFLAGLVIYLFNINHSVFLVILASVGLCTSHYLCATLVPIFYQASPCHTPLSSLVWFSVSYIPWLALKLLYNVSIKLSFVRFSTRLRIRELARVYHKWTLRDVMRDLEGLARAHSSFLDTSILSRAFGSLDGHKDMEQFLASIPGFYSSTEVEKDVPAQEKLNGKILPPAIAIFMNHSLSSDVFAEPEKDKRIATCLKAIEADPLLLQATFRQILEITESEIFRRIDFIKFAQSYSDDGDPWIRDYARCIVAVAINRAHDYDGEWLKILQHHLDYDSKGYSWHDDSVRLHNLIHLVQHLKETRLKDSDQFAHGGLWHRVLVEVCKLELTNTDPELQHEFCNMWNELVWEARAPRSRMVGLNTTRILHVLRRTYLTLHPGTDSVYLPFPLDDDLELDSYPLCTVPHHHIDVPSPIPDTIQVYLTHRAQESSLPSPSS